WDEQGDRLAFGLGELSKQYTPLGIVVSLAGLVALWRNLRAEAALLTLMVAANFAFAMNYALVGYLYFIPTFLIFGIWIGIGLAWLGRRILDFGFWILDLFRAQSKIQNPKSKIAVWALALGVGVLALVALVSRYPDLTMRGQTAA